jgi:DNA-binding transcriptional LysR family regulator
MTDWDLLQTLVIVAESSDLTAAARSLGVSQAAISQRLDRLESDWKLPLFYSVGRRRKLKPWAFELVDILKPALMDVQSKVNFALQSWIDPSMIHVRLGATRDVLSMISRHLDFPGVIELVPSNTQSALLKLQEFEVDLAILEESPRIPGLISRPLFQDHLVIISPKGWQLPKQEVVRFLFKEKNFIAYTKDLKYLRKILKEVELPLSEIHPKMIVNDWRLIIDFVSQKKGWSIVPLRLLGGIEGIQKQKLGLKEEGLLDYFIVFQMGSRKLPWFRNFILSKI